MTKIKFIILVSLLFSIQAVSQPVLKIKGKIQGYSKGDFILLNLNDEEVIKVPMKSGKFETTACDLEPNVYTIKIGLFSKKVYIENKEIEISGYIDPTNKDDYDISITELAIDSHLKDLENKIDSYRKTTRDRLVSIITSSKDKNEITEAISNYSLIDNKVNILVKKLIENEKNDNVASYLAYKYGAPYYEHAKALFDILPDKAKKSLNGNLLQEKIMKLKPTGNGQPASNIKLENEKGEIINTNDFKGKVVVMDFWASWCGACCSEIQFLKPFYETVKNDDIVFISVSLDDDKDKWLNALKHEKIPWICLWDKKGWKKSVCRDIYHFGQIPYIIVIDKDGNIASKDLRRNALIENIKFNLNK